MSRERGPTDPQQAIPEPALDVLAATVPARAIALVLPGGKAKSLDPAVASQLTAVRMRPFATALHTAGAQRGLAVWTLRYRYRGWNGDLQSPVEDASWALQQVRQRHGDVPVVLVGHSMGGRTALYAAGDASVRGVCALAPWVESGDPVDQLAGRSLLVAHGSIDAVTSAVGSRRYAKRAAAVTAPVGRLLVAGDTHAMLFRWRLWHALAVGFALSTVQLGEPPRRITRAFERGAAGDFAVWA